MFIINLYHKFFLIFSQFPNGFCTVVTQLSKKKKLFVTQPLKKNDKCVMLNDFKTKIDGLKLIKTGFKLVN